MNDFSFLQEAISKAQESVDAGGFPAGGIVVQENVVVGTGISIGRQIHDPTSHGELSAIRDACTKEQTYRFEKAVLYASLEPCLMCLGAAAWSGISRIVFALPKEKVSEEYYKGQYDVSEINALLTHPLELVHLQELEADSAAVVRAWEQHQNF